MLVNETNYCLSSLFDAEGGARYLSVVTNQSRISEVREQILHELLDSNLKKVDLNTRRFIFICSILYSQNVSCFPTDLGSGIGGLTPTAASLA